MKLAPLLLGIALFVAGLLAVNSGWNGTGITLCAFGVWLTLRSYFPPKK